MASNEGLSVAIGANLGGLTSGLDRAVSSLESFANTLQTIASSLVTAFNSVQPAVNNTASTVTALSTSVNNLSPITATAAAGITNLSTAITSGQATFSGLNTASTQASTGLNTLSTTSQQATASINRLSPVSAIAAAGITNLSQAIVSGNATFVRGINAVTNYADALQGINRNTVVASSSINRLSPVTGAAALGITNLTRAVNSGQASLTGLSRTAQYAITANQRLATSAQNIVRPTVNANGALSGFNNIIRDAPFGIIGIGNNITQLADAFGQLQRQTGSTGGALRALGSSVFGPAGLITLGLSTAISLWTAYSMRQQQAASKAKAAADEIKSLAKITQDAAISSNQFAASAAAEVTALNRLFAVARDETKSREDRTNALKELKAQTNGYLKDLTLETAQTEAARKSLDLYNKSLFDSALTKAYQGQIDDLAKSYAQTKEKADKGRKAIEEFDAALERQQQRLLKGQVSAKDRLDVPEQDAKNSIARNKLIAQTNGYIKDQNALYDQILSKGTQLADLQAKVNPFSKAENKNETGKTIASVLKELQSELKAIDAQALLTGATFDSVAKDKITALQKAFEDLIKLGLQPTSPEIKKISGEINSLGDKIIGDKPIASKFIQNLGKSVKTTKVKNLTSDELSKLLGITSGSQLQLDTKITPEVIFESAPALENLDTFSGLLTSKMTKLGKDAKEAFDKNYIVWGDALSNDLGPAIVDLGSQLRTAVADVASGVGEAIGDLISGEDGLGSALGSIIGIMADFIVQFGKTLIEAATLKIIAQKTLLSNPYLALAAGVAAVAVGTALNNWVPSFATGGVVTEPTLAMIGDNPGRKEAIVPSELWDKMGGSGAQSLSVDLDYDKLRIRLDQSGRRARR